MDVVTGELDYLRRSVSTIGQTHPTPRLGAQTVMVAGTESWLDRG